MTHVSTNRSKHAIKRAWIFAGIGALTHLVIGCTSSNSLNFPNLQSQTADASATEASQKKLAIAQLVGAPPKVTKSLSTALAKAAGERKITLEETKSDSTDYLMQGYLVADSTAKGTKMSYIWDISDAKGNRAHRINGEEIISSGPIKKGTDPWTLVNDKIIASVASKTAAQLATWLPPKKAPAQDAPMLVSDNKQDPKSTGSAKSATGTKTAQATKSKTAAPKKLAAKPAAKKAASKPVRKVAAAKPVPTRKTLQPIKVAAKPLAPKPAQPAKVMAMVPTVLGAPGDGQNSLTTAIKKQLGNRGIVLASGSTKAAYTVRGEVKMTPAAQANKEDIAIEWKVIDPKGKKLGTVSQRNSIPKGSLNGAWGQTADAAAAAAAEGIVKLLPKE